MVVTSSTDGPLIKICGLTRLEDLLHCHASGVDYVGFNFFPGSKRFIEPQAAREIWDEFERRRPGHNLRPVAVTVNPDLPELTRICSEFPGLVAIQLHGSETASFVAASREVCDIEIWKAVPVHSSADADQVRIMQKLADLVLLDSAAIAPGATVPGGSGRTFDWSQFAGLIGSPGIGVAGGLTSENISGLLQFRPALVDIASGVETSPGVKSKKKIESLVQACREQA